MRRKNIWYDANINLFVICSHTHTVFHTFPFVAKWKIKISSIISLSRFEWNIPAITHRFPVKLFPFFLLPEWRSRYLLYSARSFLVFFLAWASRSPKDATISRASMQPRCKPRETGRSVTQGDSIEVSGRAKGEKLPRKSGRDPINDLRRVGLRPIADSKSTCISSKRAAKRNRSF